MQVVIDNREHSLIALTKPLFAAAGLEEPTIAMLDIGDIQIIRNGQPYIIIERKTFDDFASSMADGRYREQKARLIATKQPNQRILYLLEGQLSIAMTRKYGRMAETSMISAWTRAMFKDGLHFLNLPTTAATADWLLSIMIKLIKDPAEYDGGAGISTTAAYVGLLTTKKKDNITPDVCYRSMLCSITGVSEIGADAIAKKWPTMVELCESLKSGAVLEDTPIPTSGGKVRRLGPAVANRIREMLGGL